MDVKDYEKMIADLKEELQKITAAKDAAITKLETTNKDLQAENKDLKAKYNDLSQSANEEITRLSKELADSKSIAVQGVLTVTVDKVKYTTPPGRKYNIGGKDVTAEELVKDQTLCKHLIDIKSHILTAVK